MAVSPENQTMSGYCALSGNNLEYFTILKKLDTPMQASHASDVQMNAIATSKTTGTVMATCELDGAVFLQ